MVKVGYDFRIDALKAFAIVSVILLHALPHDFIILSQAQFHIWQAVPIFLLLLGMNWGSSYLRAVDLPAFFTGKIKRLGVPLGIFTLISLCFPDRLYFDLALLMGAPVFRGYGSYFIALVVQFLLVIPMVMIVYQKTKPLVFLGIFFFLNLIIELLSPYIFDNLPPVYYSSFSLRYLFVVALGIYFIEHREDFFKKRIHQIGMAVSILYLIVWGYKPFYPPFFIHAWGWQHLFAFYYTGLFVLVFFNTLSQRFNKAGLLIIGQASFHIFLLQILFFGLNGTVQMMEFVKNVGINNVIAIKAVTLITVLLINIGGGVVWFLLENRMVWKK